MTPIVKAAGKAVAKQATFQETERFLGALAAVREATATAREPTMDLLAQVDSAICLTADQEGGFKKAAAPGKIVDVATYLGLLLDAYPNSGSHNAETFGGFLVDDVMDMEPPIAAVEIACRRWRQKSKFPPAISELLADIRSAKDQILSASDFIARLPTMRDRIAQELSNG